MQSKKLHSRSHNPLWTRRIMPAVLSSKIFFLLHWSINISNNLLCLIIPYTYPDLTMFMTLNNCHFHRNTLSVTSHIWFIFFCLERVSMRYRGAATPPLNKLSNTITPLQLPNRQQGIITERSHPLTSHIHLQVPMNTFRLLSSRF